MDDDFELEVTDLRTGKTLSRREDVPLPGGGATESEQGAVDELWDGEFDALGPPETQAAGIRLSRRQSQLLRSAAVVGVVVLVAVLLLGRLPDSQTALSGLLRLPTPTPTAPLPAGADTFVAVNIVPWGKLTADGRVIGAGTFQGQAYYFTLPRGRHTIEYSAPPFTTLRCTASVPAANGDTCHTLSSSIASQASQKANGVQPLISGMGRILDLGSTVEALSNEQRAALEKAIDVVLTSRVVSTTIQPGDRYLGTDGQMQTADRPLSASFIQQLNHDPGEQVQPGTPAPCLSICNVQGDAGGGWLVGANVRLSWLFMDASGNSLSAPAHFQSPATEYETFVVDWRGAWVVSSPVVGGRSTICLMLMSTGIVADIVTLDNDSSGGGFTVFATQAQNPAEGCLYTVQRTDGNAQPVGAPALYLYRYGLIFAASDAAHSAKPTFPVANAREQALAEQLAKLPPLN